MGKAHMRVGERVNAICAVYSSVQLMCRWPLKTVWAKRRLEFLPVKSRTVWKIQTHQPRWRLWKLGSVGWICGKPPAESQLTQALTSSITTQAYKQQIQIQQTCMPADKATHVRSHATIYRLIQSVKVNPSPISICGMLFFSFFFFYLLPFQFCKDASKCFFRVRNNEIADLKALKSMLVSPLRLSD